MTNGNHYCELFKALPGESEATLYKLSWLENIALWFCEIYAVKKTNSMAQAWSKDLIVSYLSESAVAYYKISWIFLQHVLWIGKISLNIVWYKKNSMAHALSKDLIVSYLSESAVT